VNNAAVEGGIWLQVWFLWWRRFRIGLIHQADLISCQCIRLRGALVFPYRCWQWRTGHDGWVVAPVTAGHDADGERKTQSR